jgi:PAS domain S-box-containing protein
MIGSYFRRSVRGKLLLVVTTTALLALLIAGAAVISYDLRTYEDSRVSELDTLGDVLAAASAPALAFRDVKDAQETLATLRTQPSILAGALYSLDGRRFASYAPDRLGDAQPSGNTPRGHLIHGGQISLVTPVIEKNERVGTLYLVAKYEAARRLLDTASIVGGVLLFSLVCAILAMAWLQRIFIRPILRMTEAARHVREEREFSVKVEKTTEDEIGYLVDTFNAMVTEVGRQSAELMESNRGLMREIAERQAAEDARQESESRFRELADNAPVLIWMNDETGRIFVNREYLNYTGRRLEQLIGFGWLELVHPEDREQTTAEYARAVERKGRFEVEHRLRRVDGRHRWFKSTGVPRTRADGTIMSYIGCSFDIHAIKEYITEIDAAERALRDADRRKDEFLAMLSHELRNPLNPIRNAAAILHLGPEATEVSWAAEVIERQSQQLSRLLEDLMDAARITQGRLEMRKQRVALSAVVDTAVETTRGLFKANQQRLDVDLPVEQVHLEADPARMAQVLGNILNNAAKYTPAGGRIRLSAAREGERVVISVKDTGAGIAAADLPHIFELFVQAKTNATHAAGGLGIGLALVRVLVQMHGGSVEARSEGPGKGSEFIVTLPVMPEARPVPAGPAAPRLAAASRRLRVLVADDVQDSADSLARLLRALRHEVHVAHDGTQALEVARQIHPDAAILDIGMPGLTGYEVATRIRRQDWGKQIMLIALTGWGQRSDVSKSQEAGFDHHMTKPADADLLASYLAQAAKGSKLH